VSETPKQHSQSDPPLDSTLTPSTEEKKNLSVFHSPEPWSLYPWAEGLATPCICFEVRSGWEIVVYVTYDDDEGVRPIELHDAALIVAAPRLLRTFRELYSGFLFLAGNAAFEAGSSGAEEIRRLKVETGTVLEDLQKAGVF